MLSLSCHYKFIYFIFLSQLPIVSISFYLFNSYFVSCFSVLLYIFSYYSYQNMDYISFFSILLIVLYFFIIQLTTTGESLCCPHHQFYCRLILHLFFFLKKASSLLAGLDSQGSFRSCNYYHALRLFCLRSLFFYFSYSLFRFNKILLL